MSKKDKPSPSRPSPSPPASHPPLLHDAEWSTFVCCILPHLPEPAPSAQLANTSLYLNHLFETIASGLRQKFVLLSQTDVVDWAVDHSKVYDACKEAKQFVDTNPRGTPLPDHILAKITKCKLLSLRQEGIEAKKTPPKPPETIEGSQFNLDSNLKKEAIAAKDAAKDKAKEKDTKEERVRSAKKSQPKVNTNETDSTPEGDTTSRRKTKLRDRVLPKAKVTPIDDEPKDGPDVYYILRDFTSAGFYRYLVDEAEIPIDSIIGLANIATQPSSDSSAPNGTPLAIATSTETSTPQPIPTKTNAEPNQNDFVENQVESINTVESQFRIFKDGTPLGAIERHSELARDSSLWKKVAFTKIDVLDLTDPVQLFDRIAKTIYQIMKRTELYQKYYNACQVISIPELPDSFFVDLSNAAPSAQNEASTLAQNMTSSYPTYNSILDTLSQYHHGSVEATLGAAIEQVLSSEAPNECIFQPSDDVAVQVNELENYIDQAINGLIGSAGEQQTVAESEKDKEKDAEKDKRQPRLMKQTRLYQLDRLSLVYPSSPPMASVLPPSSSASHNSTPITPLSFAHSIQSHSRASLLQSYLSTSRRKLCDKTLEIIDNENFLRYCELLKMVDKVEKIGVEEFEFGSLSLEFQKMLTEAWSERKDNEKAGKMEHEVTDRYWIERLDKASLLEQIEQAIFTYPIHETRMKAKDNRLYFSVIPPTLEPNGQIAKESTIEVKLKPTFSLFHKLLDSDTETFLNKSVIDFSLNSISLANEKTIDYFYEFSSPPSSSPEHNNGKVTTDIGSKMFLRTLSKDGKEGKEEKETKERNEKVEEKSEVWKRFKESVKVWCTRDGGQIVEKVWTRGRNAETEVVSKTLSILHHNCSLHYNFHTHDLKRPASVSAVLNDGSIIYSSYPITNGIHTLQSTSANDGALSGGEGKGCENDEIPTMSVSLSDGRVVEFDADGLVVRSMKCGVAGECENADKESKVVEVFRKLFWSDSSIHIYYSNQTYRILQPDGTIFERKLLPRVPTRTTSSHARSQNQVHSSRPTTSHSTSHPSDQFTIEWTKTTANGARVRSHGPAQSSNLMWEVVPSLRIATSQDPITGVVTKTREDNVTTVVHPELKNNGGKTIVQFEDETVIESCWTPQCETEYGEEQVQGLSKRVTMRIHDKDNSWNVCFEKGKMETVKVVLGRDIIVSPYLQKSVKQVDQARLVQSSVETNTSVSESIKTRQIGWSVLQIHSPSFKFISNGRGQRFALFAPTNTAFSTVESQGTLQNGVYKIDLETNVIRYRDNDNEYTFPSKVPSSSGDSLTQEHSIQDTANVNSHPKVGEIVKTLLSSHNDTIPNILSPQLFIIQEDGSGVRLWRDIELLGFFRSVAKKIENGGDVRVCEEAVKSSNESGEEEDGAVIAVWVIERLGVSEVAYRKLLRFPSLSSTLRATLLNVQSQYAKVRAERAKLPSSYTVVDPRSPEEQKKSEEINRIVNEMYGSPKTSEKVDEDLTEDEILKKYLSKHEYNYVKLLQETPPPPYERKQNSAYATISHPLPSHDSSSSSYSRIYTQPNFKHLKSIKTFKPSELHLLSSQNGQTKSTKKVHKVDVKIREVMDKFGFGSRNGEGKIIPKYFDSEEGKELWDVWSKTESATRVVPVQIPSESSKTSYIVNRIGNGISLTLKPAAPVIPETENNVTTPQPASEETSSTTTETMIPQPSIQPKYNKTTYLRLLKAANNMRNKPVVMTPTVISSKGKPQVNLWEKLNRDKKDQRGKIGMKSLKKLPAVGKPMEESVHPEDEQTVKQDDTVLLDTNAKEGEETNHSLSQGKPVASDPMHAFIQQILEADKEAADFCKGIENDDDLLTKLTERDRKEIKRLYEEHFGFGDRFWFV